MQVVFGECMPNYKQDSLRDFQPILARFAQCWHRHWGMPSSSSKAEIPFEIPFFVIRLGRGGNPRAKPPSNISLLLE